MKPTPSTPRPEGARGRAAFTLIELVTAASLMTIMMLGVVQVFGIITQTAGEAQGLSYAQQQMRAFFNTLNRDFRGMTREGYLRIRSGRFKFNQDGLTEDASLRTTPYVLGASAALPLEQEVYRADTLAFVTVGATRGIWGSMPVASCAEVVYTSNVRTPNNIWQVKLDSSTEAVKVGPRRGILARGQWIMAGGAPGIADDRADTSKAPFLADMFRGLNDSSGASIVPDRISTLTTPAAGRTDLVVWPWSSLTSECDYPSALRRVMACCISDFHVEYYDIAKDSADADLTQGTGFSSRYAMNAFRKTYSDSNLDCTWSEVKFTGTSTAGSLRTWPRAIRVTVAAHDPGDNAPLTGPAGTTRFRGFAMQETFLITDP